MIKKKVAILCGGFDKDTKLSQKSANFVLKNIDTDIFSPQKVELKEENLFLSDRGELTLEELGENFDVVFNCLIGKKAHDGKLVKAFEMKNISFIGSSSVTSAITSDRKLLSEFAEKFGFNIPSYQEFKITKDSDLKKKAQEIFVGVPQPCVFRSNPEISLFEDVPCKSIDEIENFLEDLDLEEEKTLLIEEYLEGNKVSVFAIENFIEGSAEFYFTPFNLENGEPVSNEVSDQALDVARAVYKNFDLSGHFAVTLDVSKRGAILVSVNNFPVLAEDSVFVKKLDEYGIDYKNFISHLINTSLDS